MAGAPPRKGSARRATLLQFCPCRAPAVPAILRARSRRARILACVEVCGMYRRGALLWKGGGKSKAQISAKDGICQSGSLHETPTFSPPWVPERPYHVVYRLLGKGY
jgi:hypothetical protein